IPKRSRRGIVTLGRVELLSGEGQVAEIVATRSTPSGFAGHIYCGQQQRRQNGNDRDHDQHLDERKSSPRLTTSWREQHGWPPRSSLFDRPEALSSRANAGQESI